LKVQQR